MILRSVVKLFAIAALTVASLTVIAIAGFVGLLFYKAAVPERMGIQGRIKDEREKPLSGVVVRVIPWRVHDPFGEEPVKTGAREESTVTDRNGRYRFRRLIAAGGVKEGSWVQKYDVEASAEGYAAQATTFQPTRGGGGRKDLDFVLVRNRKTAPNLVDVK